MEDWPHFGPRGSNSDPILSWGGLEFPNVLANSEGKRPLPHKGLLPTSSGISCSWLLLRMMLFSCAALARMQHTSWLRR